MARSVIYDKGGALSTIDGLLKDHDVIKEITDTINKSTVITSRLKSEKATAGRKFFFPVQLGVSQGHGARAENKALPGYGFGEYAQATGNTKYLYSTFYITGQSISATKGNKAAFADAMKQALKDCREGLKLDVQRQIWGDGTGALGKVSGAHAGVTTLAVTSPYGLTYTGTLTNDQKTRLFKRNMSLFIDSSTDTNVTVTGVNKAAGTLTVSAAVTAADGDIIYRGDSASDVDETSKDNELDGITGMVAATGTYLGIDRTGKPEWQSHLIQQSGALAEEDLRGLVDTIEIHGNQMPNLLITDHATRAIYEKLLQSNKRFVNPMNLEGGFKALEFDGMPLVVDRDAPPQRIWALNTSDIVWMVMEEFDWMDQDGAVLSRVTGRDAYEATLFGYKNLACKRPANQGVLYDVAS